MTNGQVSSINYQRIQTKKNPEQRAILNHNWYIKNKDEKQRKEKERNRTRKEQIREWEKTESPLIRLVIEERKI